MKNRRNYYRILQVQPDAPFEVIRAAYRALMRELKHHPDLGGDVFNAQVLNEAYETLSDPARREAYDRKLFERYTRQPLREPVTGRPPLITLFCPFCKRPLARKANPNEQCPTCKSPLRSAEAETLRDACRRAQVRIKRSGTFYYYTTWPQKRRKALLVDISKDGLRFHCSEHLREDMLIKASGPLFRGVARVTNVHKLFLAGHTTYAVGGQFVSVVFAQQAGTFYSSSA